MLRKYLSKKRKSNFKDMEEKVSNLSNEELKEWFINANAQRIIGDTCDNELKLLEKIENELNSRGFEHTKDF